MEAASRSRSSAPSQPGSAGAGPAAGGAAVPLSCAMARGLRRQEQQGEQRAAKHSVERLEGNACNNVTIYSDPPSATLPGDNESLEMA